jgi:hypothetical protein
VLGDSVIIIPHASEAVGLNGFHVTANNFYTDAKFTRLGYMARVSLATGLSPPKLAPRTP